MGEWRLLDTGLLTAAENMALDDALLDCRANYGSPNTIRFLRFDPQSVLVGFHQSVEHQVREEFCEENGIDINRRITGGGTIYFNKESLGWEVIASKAELGRDHPMFNTRTLFKEMCSGVIHGLQSLGVNAEFKSRNDIEVDGRKISGTGGTERDDAFLFQGTLLIDFDADTMLRSLKIPVEKLKDKEIESMKERVTCLKWALGYTPAMGTIKRALIEGFEQAFDIKLVEQGLTTPEEALFKEKLPYYESLEWVYGERTPLEAVAEVYSLRKTEGGLVRASLILDLSSNLIKNALITGDFFIFPSRAILARARARYGTDGIRKLLQVNDRPLVGTIIKPKLGLKTSDHAKVSYEAWVGGCDIIKDDENLSSQNFNPFEDRVVKTLEMRDRSEEETGEKKVYMVNVTAGAEEMRARAQRIREFRIEI